MKDLITDLEIRLTHHELGLQELNDAVLHQQKLIDNLTTEVEILKQQLRAQAQFNIAQLSEETPPPHY